jgi:hypothetical protein
LYETLIERYKDSIEANEAKSISALKASVQPAHERILPVIDKIRSEASSDLKAYERAKQFVDDIRSVPGLNVSFWLSINEMLEQKIADFEDKAILLCSMLKGLGAQARVVIVELADGTNRPLVLLETPGKIILLDANQEHFFYAWTGAPGDVFPKYSYGGQAINRVLYEFNDTDYVSHIEEPE